MSGWNTADRMMEEDTGNDFPAVNNISVAGYMPHDQVPAPGKHINLNHFSPFAVDYGSTLQVT